MPPLELSAKLTYYICYNQISYLVASEHALRQTSGHCVILAARDRVVIQARYAGTSHRALSRWQVLLACMWCVFLRPVVVYIPHHRLGRILRLLVRLASSVRLVDDGLDTVRQAPANVQVQKLGAIDELLTFDDYEVLASWTNSLVVTRVCSLAILCQDSRPAMDPQSFDVLAIQSPGVNLAEVGKMTGVRDEKIFVFVHGNPAKRTLVPAGFRQSTASVLSIEKTIASFQGTVVSGETMVTLFTLYCAPHASLILQLSAKQYRNLNCLHKALAMSGARVELH
jgi:hypothetical protein